MPWTQRWVPNWRSRPRCWILLVFWQTKIARREVFVSGFTWLGLDIYACQSAILHIGTKFLSWHFAYTWLPIPIQVELSQNWLCKNFIIPCHPKFYWYAIAIPPLVQILWYRYTKISSTPNTVFLSLHTKIPIPSYFLPVTVITHQPSFLLFSIFSSHIS